MASRHHEIVLPDLGLGEVAVTVSLWLVEPGDEVSEGDRVVEVLAGSVTVDLSAPAGGTLIEARVAEDEPLEVGQVLGVVESREGIVRD